ncbi:hypothetical protein [Prochlorococcus marinus]|uniref:hypothetical protein n=1 Tax=Prochlorococcus marinus TaxID=1219 RepID=UPI001ADA77EC|nr:hypothetical protein [Prochlorococcus marinus]MBO8204851.1 hypothetical protein [Prochlorococcus marinus CUG1415]MBW3044125.1 hypothetical protein [Prochlorococcus marinus str. MU1415]
MKLNKALKLTLGALIAIPFSLIVGNEILANNLTENFKYELSSDNLIACGGGGGGSSPAAKKAKKAKQAKAKLSFKKRQLSKKAAAGEDTSNLAAEIAELEALIAE